MFDLLVFLIENRDRVVSKDDLLLPRSGAGASCRESTLDSRVNAARHAIGDSGRECSACFAPPLGGESALSARCKNDLQWKGPQETALAIPAT